MEFADAPGHRASRHLECGWSARSQTAEDIAERVQEMVRRLVIVDPAYGRIRPDPGSRKFRTGDRGPVLEMPLSEVAELIERRGRFDPPRYPAPVSPEGYRVSYRNDILDFRLIYLGVRASVTSRGAKSNLIEVWPDRDHPLWRDPNLGIRILDDIARVWDAEWASGYAYLGRADGGVRPWLAWTEEPLRARAEPPYISPYPFPFSSDNPPLPSEVRPWRGGELRIWL